MTTSLYSRLGGYDGIAKFSTDVVGIARKDDLLGRFWRDRGEDRNARELQLLIDYIVNSTGGQMYYKGRDMLLTHKGMGITTADWTRFNEIVVSVVGELGIGPNEAGEVMDFLESLKPDIVSA
ncbi:MAG: group 1 truncated hemoglobin [Granulosicoccaceae bacterium]